MAPRTDQHTHRPHPMLAAEFSRRVGRSRGQISKLLRAALAPARMRDGRVDAGHPAVIEYAQERGVDLRALLAPLPADAPTAALLSELPPERASDDADDSDPDHGGGDDRDPRDPTRRDFLRVNFKKRKAEADRLASKLARDEGRLISRQLVHTHVMAHLDASNHRLLTDVCRSLVARLAPLAKADQSLATMESVARELVGKELRSLKQRAARAFRGDTLATGDTPHPVDDQSHRAAERQDSQLQGFARMVRTELTERASAKLFDAIAKTFARAATGKPWNPAVFDSAMHVASTVEAEATAQLATMLGAVVDRMLNASLGTEETTEPAE